MVALKSGQVGPQYTRGDAPVMVRPEALLSATRVTSAPFQTLNSLRQPAPRTVTLISTLIQAAALQISEDEPSP